MKKVSTSEILDRSVKSSSIKKNWHAATNFAPSKSYTNSQSISDFSSFLPVIFQSPYIDTDLQIFEGIWANTLIGRVIDVRVEFAIGRGVRPTFVLNDKRIKDPKEKQEKLKQYDDILTELEKIDYKHTIKLNRKVPGMLRDMHVFGRSVLAFEPGGVGSKAKLPIAIKPIHPRDLGRVFVHQLDWSLSSCYAFQKTQLIDAEEMVYLAQMPNSPIRRSLNYGYSSIQRMMGQARALRRINEFDIPEVAEAMWAKYGLLTVDQDGMTDSEKQADLTTIRNGLKAGSFNLITAKKDEINFWPLDTEPKVGDMALLKDSIEKDAIGNFNAPGGLFGREADQTRATMLGKIRLFISGPVESDRRILGEALGEQWYEHNIKLLGHEDILDEVSIEVTYEPIIIESWMDNVAAVTQLKQLIPSIPEDEILRLLDLPDLIGKLKPIREDGQKKLITPENLKEIADTTKDSETKNKIANLIEIVSK